MKTFARILGIWVPVAAVWAVWAQAPQGRQADSEIKTLLDRSCVSCHSGAQAAGGLSLDSPAGIAKGGKSGAAVTPGNASTSPLFQRVVATDRAVRMPLGGSPLNAGQIASIKRWIDDGA